MLTTIALSTTLCTLATVITIALNDTVPAKHLEELEPDYKD